MCFAAQLLAPKAMCFENSAGLKKSSITFKNGKVLAAIRPISSKKWLKVSIKCKWSCPRSSSLRIISLILLENLKDTHNWK